MERKKSIDKIRKKKTQANSCPKLILQKVIFDFAYNIESEHLI